MGGLGKGALHPWGREPRCKGFAKTYGAEGKKRVGLGRTVAFLSGGHMFRLESKQAPLPHRRTCEAEGSMKA